MGYSRRVSAQPRDGAQYRVGSRGLTSEEAYSAEPSTSQPFSPVGAAVSAARLSRTCELRATRVGWARRATLPGRGQARWREVRGCRLTHCARHQVSGEPGGGRTLSRALRIDSVSVRSSQAHVTTSRVTNVTWGEPCKRAVRGLASARWDSVWTGLTGSTTPLVRFVRFLYWVGTTLSTLSSEHEQAPRDAPHDPRYGRNGGQKGRYSSPLTSSPTPK
jgi:hypothetical protein